jgi:hypothetical protein
MKEQLSRPTHMAITSFSSDFSFRVFTFSHKVNSHHGQSANRSAQTKSAKTKNEMKEGMAERLP